MANSKVGNVIDLSLFRRVLALATPFKSQFISSVVLALLIAFITPARPWLIQKTIDEYIAFYNVSGLIKMSLIMIGLLLIESVFRYYFSYITSWIGQSIIKNLRVNIYQHILGLKLQYFDKTPIGASTTRTINDTEAINDTFSQGIIDIFADMITLIVVIAIMLYTDVRLTLISLSVLPLMIISTYIFKEKVKTAFKIVREQISRLNAFVQEHLAGVSIVQIFNAQDREYEKFKEINKKHLDANVNTVFYYSVFFPVVEIVLAASLGLLIWQGTNKVLDGQTTLGTLIAFILYLNMLFRPIRLLADKFNTLQMGLVAADRVFTILDTDEHIENVGKISASNIKGNIQFVKVNFAYINNDYVLKDVSFEIKEGEALAIVGSTGSGKTTIINILNRFYEINNGTIKIDGVAINKYDLYSLRSNISLVLQDVFLFSGSILDNITLKNEKITKEEVSKAAEMIGADRFINRLPGKYNYQVMERGATLSVGQRQLISFLRAMVFNPRILIFR